MNVSTLFTSILLTSLVCVSIAFAEIKFTDEFLAQIQKNYGEYAKRRLVTWQKIVAENKEKTEREKLDIVNNFFNLLEFKSDLDHWGLVDYWATPLEMIVSGAGDCEDYSIGKYLTLLELGVPDKKMMITYTKAIEYNQAHMVLTYYETPASVPLVLDNINGTILPATKRTDLIPIYSFNGTGLWQAKQRGLGNKIGEADDMKNWTSMSDRMKSGKIGKFN